jgi:(p)ppGpp synthase/HD superfamily hydrolase
MSLTNLKSTIHRYYGDFDQNALKEIYLYAKKSYQDQIRHSGNTQLSHAVAVAQILASWKMPTSLVYAGLLHDIPMDDKFGPEIKELLTNFQSVKILSEIPIIKNILELTTFFLALAKDLRVVFFLAVRCMIP